MQRSSVGVLVGLSLAGCGGSESEPAFTLTIPVRPVSSVLLAGLSDVTSERVRMDATLDLALGDSYPSELRHRLPEKLFATCGTFDGDLSLREITGGPSPAIDASLEGNEARYVVRGEGVADLVVHGDYVHGQHAGSCPDIPAAGARVPFEAHVRIVVRRPASAAVVLPLDCRSAAAARVAPSARLSEFAPQLVDGQGEVFHADNATADAQAELIVRAHHALALDDTLPVALSAVVVPAVAGTVEIIPSVGVPLDVHVVDAARITSLDVAFEVPGVAAGSLVIESGDLVRGAGRANNRIVPTTEDVAVGADPLCSAPAASWFELTSATPDICEVQPFPFGHGEVVIGGAPLADAAVLRANGVCNIELRAPDLGGGAGRTWAVAATIEDVEFFTEVTPVSR